MISSFCSSAALRRRDPWCVRPPAARPCCARDQAPAVRAHPDTSTEAGARTFLSAAASECEAHLGMGIIVERLGRAADKNVRAPVVLSRYTHAAPPKNKRFDLSAVCDERAPVGFSRATTSTFNFQLLLLLAALVFSGACAPGADQPAAQKTFIVTDSGAAGDGKTLNTAGIQKAIERCAAAGGGMVVVPKGTFITGSIFLKQGVNLPLD